MNKFIKAKLHSVLLTTLFVCANMTPVYGALFMVEKSTATCYILPHIEQVKDEQENLVLNTSVNNFELESSDEILDEEDKNEEYSEEIDLAVGTSDNIESQEAPISNDISEANPVDDKIDNSENIIEIPEEQTIDVEQ
ncbi:MAG: hypothetical protein Q4E99_04475 [Bacillota bacterium]|nr:hypothetical protein [Bacillota bacterium]